MHFRSVSHMPPARRLTGMVVLAAVLMATNGFPVGVDAAPPVNTARSAAWKACHTDLGDYECATVRVPLDHDHPRGGTLSIALVRLPATNPGARIGSLFINPGGPGGSGVDILLAAGRELLPRRIGERFDLVGFDPRGVGRSNVVRCLPTQRRFDETIGVPFAYPISPAEEATQIAADQRLAAECARGDTRLLQHMSTAEVARDLDLLRIAVGDSHLSYLGVSYGSYLGATYAHLFPHRVRALALDAVLDPVQWSVGRPGTEGLPVTTRLGSGPAANDTLDELFRLCDLAGPQSDPTGPGCAFAGELPAAQRYAALVQRLTASPEVIQDPWGGEIREFGPDDLIATTLGGLYEAAIWPLLADVALGIEQQLPPLELGARFAHLAAAGHRSRYFGVEAFSAVLCTDSDGPVDPTAWSAAAAEGDAIGYFERPWTWDSSACAVWPFRAEDRFVGPWGTSSAPPVLILSNLHDPATPFSGAVALHDLMPNSHVIAVDGWGHVATGTSTCADDAVAAYLVDLAPPAVTQCSPDYVPFVDPPLPFLFGG